MCMCLYANLYICLFVCFFVVLILVMKFLSLNRHWAHNEAQGHSRTPASAAKRAVVIKSASFSCPSSSTSIWSAAIVVFSLKQWGLVLVFLKKKRTVVFVLDVCCKWSTKLFSFQGQRERCLVQRTLSVWCHQTKVRGEERYQIE